MTKTLTFLGLNSGPDDDVKWTVDHRFERMLAKWICIILLKDNTEYNLPYDLMYPSENKYTIQRLRVFLPDDFSKGYYSMVHGCFNPKTLVFYYDGVSSYIGKNGYPIGDQFLKYFEAPVFYYDNVYINKKPRKQWILDTGKAFAQRHESMANVSNISINTNTTVWIKIVDDTEWRLYNVSEPTRAIAIQAPEVYRQNQIEGLWIRYKLVDLTQNTLGVKWFTQEQLIDVFFKMNILKRIVAKNYDGIQDKLWKPPSGLMINRNWEKIQSVLNEV